MSHPFDVLTATAVDLQERLELGTLTSVQIIEAYLSQITAHNHSGLKLNALICVAPEESVLAQARKLDEERKEGRVRGPLHGLPIIVKVGNDDDYYYYAPMLFALEESILC